MNTIRQLQQLVRLDLVRSRWYVAALAVAFCLDAAMVILGAGGNTEEIEIPVFTALASFGIVLVAMLSIIGTVIQNDSPSDDAAFWRAVPVSPHTLVLGKIMTLAIAIVLPAVITEAVAWSALPVTGSDATAASLKALATMVAFLLFPAIVAALTPSFRSFVLGTVLLIAASTALAKVSFIESGNQQMSAAPWFSIVQILASLVMFAWLVSLYWARSSAPRKRVLSACVVLCCSYVPVSVFTIGQKLRSKAASAAVDTTQRNFEARAAGRDVFLTFEVPAPTHNHRLSVVSPEAQLTTSGRAVTLIVNGAVDSRHTLMNGVPQPGRLLIRLVDGANMVVIDSTAAPRVGRVTLQFFLPSGIDTPSAAEGKLALKFSAFLETETLDTLLNFSADTTHSIAQKGWIFKLSLLTRADSGRRLLLEGSSPTPNAELDAQLFSFGYPLSADYYRLRAQGYYIPGKHDIDYKLFSVATGDSVPLSQGAGGQTNLALPIISSAFARVSYSYQPVGNPAGEASLPDMQNVRFLATRWRYGHHLPIGGTIRVH